MTDLKILPLKSSSKGNAILVCSERVKLLIDCGISGKRLEEALRSVEVDPTEISAAVVTHEHSDHTKGLGIFSRKYSVPIFANLGTWNAMRPSLGKLDDDNIRIISEDTPFCIDDISITAFEISHDAAAPVGYVFETEHCRAAVATDMGFVSRETISHLSRCREVLIEANYDPNMLDMGRYPFELKQRIKSDRGHLANDDAAYLAETLVKSGTRRVILGHLSEENNLPQLAYHTVKNALSDAGVKIGCDAELLVASRLSAGFCDI